MNGNVNMYEIKTISVPDKTGLGKPAKYPWAQMEVGQCFDVMPEEFRFARIAASAWKRTHPGWNYTTRKNPDGGRIWRTE
jgi:hypothetical protein